MEKPLRPRLLKIKSTPGGGALTEARKTPLDADDMISRPTSPTFVPDFLLQSTGSVLPRSAHVASYDQKRTKMHKIKPLLRQFSSAEQMDVDLSKSLAENEAFHLYSNSEIMLPARLGSLPKSSSTPLTQALRPTPRPLALSQTNEEEIPTPRLRDSQSLTGSTSHVRTGSSYASSSYLNFSSGTPSSLRFPTNLSSDLTIGSPTTARTSLDSTNQRSRSSTTQTQDQVATVQQLRKQFQQKEAAKERRYREAEQRAVEKERRRQDRSQASSMKGRGKRKRGESNATDSERTINSREKTLSTPASLDFRAQPYAASAGTTPPDLVPQLSQQHRSPEETLGYRPAREKAQSLSSQWSLFWFWLRTYWIKLKRNVRVERCR